MNICLRDRALFLLAAGEGTAQTRAHLRSCLHCARRYQRLTRQLHGIEWTLRETAPPTVTYVPAVSHRYWVPLTAALAAALLLIWGGVWTPSPQLQPARRDSPLFFFAEERMIIAPLASVPAEAYLEAAFTEGGWPCEWQEPFSTPTCEIHPFPLALAKQSLEEVMYE